MASITDRGRLRVSEACTQPKAGMIPRAQPRGGSFGFTGKQGGAYEAAGIGT